MALTQDIEISNTGFVAGYWRIGKLEYFPGEPNADANGAQIPGCSGLIDVTMYGYADHAARVGGKAWFTLQPFRISAAALGVATVYEASAAQIYASIKTRSEFAGAVDS